MDKQTKLKRLERHLKALESAYDKIMDVLEKEMDTKKGKDEGEEDLSLKDSQIDTFAKGVLTASKTANSLLDQIEEKEEAIEKLKNPEKHKESVIEKIIEKEGDSKLNKRLKNG